MIFKCRKCGFTKDIPHLPEGSHVMCKCGSAWNPAGPQLPPPPWFTKWGDMVAATLEFVGIRRRNSCGCKKRQKWLNRIGLRAYSTLSRQKL